MRVMDQSTKAGKPKQSYRAAFRSSMLDKFVRLRTQYRKDGTFPKPVIGSYTQTPGKRCR